MIVPNSQVGVDARVLFVAPLPPPTTGQSLASQVLLDELVRRGVVTTVLNINKASLKSGIGSMGRIADISRLLWRLVSDGRTYDAIYFTPAESVAGNLKDLLVYFVLRRQLSRTYIHMHGGAGMRQLLSDEHAILRRVNGYFLKRLAGIVVLGESFVPMYSQFVPRERIHVVMNFAQDDLFIRLRTLKQKLADSSVFRVLFLSNLIPGKGYDDLLEGVQLISGQLKGRIRVDFAGLFESRSDEAAFREKISGLSFVTYHGAVFGENKRTLFQQAHVFCLPTYYPYEGQPISILEAYAAGCSVVTTDHSGIPDVFKDGRNGVRVQVKSPASIARAIDLLGADPILLRRTAVTNARQARRHFRRQHHLELLSNVLRVR